MGTPSQNGRKPDQPFSPEAELILTALKEGTAQEKAPYLARLTQRELDWDFILATSLNHGIRPLLFLALEGLGPDRVPARVLEHLGAAYQKSALMNLALAREQLQITRDLKAEGIEVLPHKGPLLAAALYGNLALREIADLDFLIHQRDFSRIKSLLCERGYHQIYAADLDDAAYLHDVDHYEYGFCSDDGQIRLEMHWRLLHEYSSFGLNPDFLWQRVVPREIYGQTVYTFPPEELFAFACVHNEKHNWKKIRFIVDVSRMLTRAEEVDWERVLELARAIRREDAVLISACLARVLFEIPLPPALEHRITRRHRLYTALLRANLFRAKLVLPTLGEWRQCWRKVGREAPEDGHGSGRWREVADYVRTVMRMEYDDEVFFKYMPSFLSGLSGLAGLFRLFRLAKAAIMR